MNLYVIILVSQKNRMQGGGDVGLHCSTYFSRLSETDSYKNLIAYYVYNVYHLLVGGVLYGNILFPGEFKWGIWLQIALGFSFLLEICVDPPYLGILNVVSKSIFSQILHNLKDLFRALRAFTLTSRNNLTCFDMVIN